MPCEHMDATILLERPPEFEIIDGLIYVTDRVGSLTIRRCMRPSAFMRSIAMSIELARQFDRQRRGKVVPLHAATGKSSK